MYLYTYVYAKALAGGPRKTTIECVQEVYILFPKNSIFFAHAIYMLNRKEILNCGLSPYELHFGCRLPPGYLHRTYRPEILSGLTEEQINADRKILDKERKDFEACIGFIEKQLREKRQARIDKLNKIRQNHDYQIGDYVVVLDYKRWLGKNKKLRPMYLSTPFKIE